MQPGSHTFTYDSPCETCQLHIAVLSVDIQAENAALAPAISTAMSSLLESIIK